MAFKLNLSVHDIVDFVLREGDIDNRIYNMNTMQEGSKIHSYYQSKMSDEYNSEYFLSHDFSYDEFDFHIEGRADGLIKKDDYFIIDEIKSTIDDIDDFHTKNEKWHLGQAEVYAYFYSLKNEHKKAKIVLTYISQNDYSKMKKFYYEFSFEKLELDFYSLIEEFLFYKRKAIQQKRKLDSSLKNIQFPYKTLNKHQDELIKFINDVEKENNSKAMIEAPTGIGKTISFLYSSIKNFKKYDKIFYLTAKSSGKEIVGKTIQDIANSGAEVKSIILTAKEKICPKSDSICNPEYCEFAREYYTKLKDVILASLTDNINVYDEAYITQVMEKYNICPFEFQLDLSLFCDVIVGDYNYIFDPFVSLERYVENDLSKHLLLVDEAHNLLDRCRGMYSSSLCLNMFLNTKKSLRSLKSKKIKTNVNKIIKMYEETIQYTEADNEVLSAFDPKIILALEKFVENYKEQNKLDYKTITSQYKNCFMEVNKFLKLYSMIGMDECCLKYFSKKDVFSSFNVFCLSPSKFIKDATSRFRNTILFSGTMEPFEYYNEVYFNNDDTVIMQSFESPFDCSRMNLMINRNLSIKYADRNNTISSVCSQIIALITSKPGNYLVFVPSYEYLSLLRENIKPLNNINYLYQEKNMSEKERQNFLFYFKIKTNMTNVGFCVLGGSFSESINLVGDALIGVVIIGVGLPSISFENNQIKEFYERNEIDGFHYAYIVPGFKNVIQAVGRLIRSDNDYGSVLLIDQRYGYSQYKNLFRKEWKNYKSIYNDQDIFKNMDIFYKKISNQ